MKDASYFPRINSPIMSTANVKSNRKTESAALPNEL